MKKIAFIVTFTGLLLPCKLRVYYGFLLNFILSPLNILRQLFVIITDIILFILLSFAYYLVIPVTLILRPKEEAHPKPVCESIGYKNIFRMF